MADITGKVWVISINRKIKGVASTQEKSKRLLHNLIQKYGFKKSLECVQVELDSLDITEICTVIHRK